MLVPRASACLLVCLIGDHSLRTMDRCGLIIEGAARIRREMFALGLSGTCPILANWMVAHDFRMSAAALHDA